MSICTLRIWCICQGFGISSFWRELLVRIVIRRSVFLKRFVINVVSLPMCMKGAHLCVVVSLCWSEVLLCLGVGILCVWTRNPLFSMISQIVSSSSLYSLLCRWYAFTLLYVYLMAAYLCWGGWLEECGMIVSVKQGFLYMEISQFVGVFADI
jgi:hypothetical protein